MGKFFFCPARRSFMIKRIISVFFALGFSFCTLYGCKKNGSFLDKESPVTLELWHVYGEQADSPMERYINEFNSTVGKEKGIVVSITFVSNASQVGKQLADAQQGKADVHLPDLFFCHTSNAVEFGTQYLIDWKQKFSEEELSEFVHAFVSDGTANGKLCVLPVSKSTHLLFLAGNAFNRFAEEKNVSYKDLETWDGFFRTAEKYYEYSGGKPFCALDYLLRSVELDAISRGAKNFYTANGWYKTNDLILNSYKKFALAIAKGHIVVSDLYSNTQVMTGQTVSGISSSAAVLYYNDKITYPDNSQEDTNLKILPVPQSGVEKLATQAGVGLCAYKSTEQKEEAQFVFAKWFTEEKRNLDFVAETGYMPVKNGAFDKLAEYPFRTEAFRDTYAALKTTRDSCKFLSEPTTENYFPNTYLLYGNIRNVQKQLKDKLAAGETTDDVAQELIDLFLKTGS